VAILHGLRGDGPSGAPINRGKAMILEADHVVASHAARVVMPEISNKCGHRVAIAVIGAWLAPRRLRLDPPCLYEFLEGDLDGSLSGRPLRWRPLRETLRLWVRRIVALRVSLPPLDCVA